MLVGILSRSGLIGHLVCLEKKTPNSYLLLERGLVLALVLLLNIDQGNVPDVCEVPILRLVNSLSDEKVSTYQVKMHRISENTNKKRRQLFMCHPCGFFLKKTCGINLLLSAQHTAMEIVKERFLFSFKCLLNTSKFLSLISSSY